MPSTASTSGPVLTVVGSANVDLVASLERLPHPGETVEARRLDRHAGGKGLNQAVAAARSGCPTAFVGAVGDDDDGRWLRTVLIGDGIDADGLAEIPDAPTGIALIGVDDGGENSIIVAPGANRHVAVTELAETSKIMLAQLEIGIESTRRALGRARERSMTTILNPAPADALDDALLALVDIVIPNEHELARLGGVDRLLAAGPTSVIVTRGAAGVTVHAAGRAQDHPARPARVVDTTGAGDAFCGVFAGRLALGRSMTEAVAWGVAAGSLATEVAGAVPSLPTAEAIGARLAR